MSSVPTRTREEALERLAWYARRWTIESWHRVLKSGCRVEARQFANLDRFVCATALFAVIGWRIMYATLLARFERDLPRDVLLQPIVPRAQHDQTACPASIAGPGRAVDRQTRRLPEPQARPATRADCHVARLSCPARNYPDVSGVQTGRMTLTCG
ncbi:MAG TPA: hypothetical protein VG105_05310 [Paraburkholderia sp.]|nr:hypothetical protein [Paraburkholderia sp.]